MASLFKRKRVPEGVDPSRIPPGQTLTAPDRWPLLHFGPVPKTDIARWDLNVCGAVEKPITLDYGELRALEGVDPSRIPPGQTLTAPDRWPLLHFGPVPKTDIAKWDFNIFGAVENPLRLDYGELRALPAKDVVADIHCVTGWSRLGDRWTGVPIKDILVRVKPKPEAKYVTAHCDYGYTPSVPLAVLDNEDNLLCYA